MIERLCTYIVRVDSGFAPNPFWDVCTLAVCTPNHQGVRLKNGDWVAGFLTKKRGHKFLYAMEISEILGLNEYFHDQRFALKKPLLQGSWKERCGDNFYSKKDNGDWIQHRNRFHLSDEFLVKDTRYPRVLIGQRFWYLGKSAIQPPLIFAPLIGGRGARVNHDPILVLKFCEWVSESFEVGRYDLPNDNPDIQSFLSLEGVSLKSGCNGNRVKC